MRIKNILDEAMQKKIMVHHKIFVETLFIANKLLIEKFWIKVMVGVSLNRYR